jgi:cysteine-S-conjugate beta-lyase
MRYDFDSVIDRRNTGSVKWDFAEEFCSVKDVLPMWVADMDFKSPQPVIDALGKAVARGIFGYTRATDSYYQAVIGWMRKRHKWYILQEWFVFSPGVIPALHAAIKAFSDPGDEIVVQTPVYYPFFKAIKNTGRIMLENPLILDGDRYRMDLDDLEEKVSPRTKAIILCSPHNPVGRVWTEEELSRLGELCLRKKIFVIADEIHHDLVYTGFEHRPFAAISKDFADNCIVCTGASKTFNLPGLHTANIIIPNSAVKRRFVDVVNSCGTAYTNMFGVLATEAAYRHGESWLLELLEYLEGNFRFLTEYCAEQIPGTRIVNLQGTYLAWLDFRGCGVLSEKLANFVREDAKVALEAGTIFGSRETGFERMNLACPRSVLAEALDRIAKAVNRLSNH